VVFVRKKDDTLRFCIDNRKMNAGQNYQSHARGTWNPTLHFVCEETTTSEGLKAAVRLTLERSSN